MSLFTPKWITNPERTAALKDQRKIEKAVKESLNEEVRLTAIKMLQNDRLLMEIVNTSEIYSEKEQYAALVRIKDPSILRAVALDAGVQYQLRIIAIKTLKDPDICESVLMEYASQMEYFNDYRKEICDCAALTLYSLGDEARLEDILKKCSAESSVQNIVMSYIQNQSLLEQAAMDEDGRFWSSSSVAVRKINDEKILLRIALNARDSDARKAAAKKLKSELFLQEFVVSNNNSIYLRLEICKRLHDRSAILNPLKEELLPVIVNDPWRHQNEISLLARCGEMVSRVLRYCLHSFGDPQTYEFNIKDLVLQSDHDMLYQALKNLLTALLDWVDENAVYRFGPDVAECIKLLHDSGIMTAQIERDFPKVVTKKGVFINLDAETISPPEQYTIELNLW